MSEKKNPPTKLLTLKQYSLRTKKKMTFFPSEKKINPGQTAGSLEK
jgi:hypothetical protein